MSHGPILAFAYELIDDTLMTYKHDIYNKFLDLEVNGNMYHRL